MLKADLHLHTNVDPSDTFIKYSPYNLIDRAATLGFNVLSLTHHKKVIFNQKWADYARKKNILLIPGTEAQIEGKDVLLYNFTQKEVLKIKKFKNLASFAKKKDRLIIAPHMYYPIPSILYKTHSVGWSINLLIQYVDAIEYCHLYSKYFNILNYFAKKIATKHHLPLIANSDAHALNYMGSNYTLIDAEPNILSIFKAIRNKKVKIITRPRTLKEMLTLTTHLMSPSILKKLIMT